MYNDPTSREKQSQTSTSRAYQPYAHGSTLTSTTHPSGDYYSSANGANSNFSTYSPYTTTTAPTSLPQTQQQHHIQQQRELDWYSSSVSMSNYPTADTKVSSAPSPYAAVGQSYPTSHHVDTNTIYNTMGSSPYINASTFESSKSNSTLPYSSFPNLKKTESVEMLSNPYSGTMNSNLYASGSSAAAAVPSYTNFFQMNTNTSKSNTIGSSYYQEEGFSHEPPLLEELGINISHITTKSLAVLLPMSRKYAKSSDVLNSHTIEESPDLAGPLAFAILLGSELLLAGKIHFAYIYSLSLFSCIAMTILLNLLSPNQSISIWTVISVLGYCLLPVNLVAALNVFIRIKTMKKVGLVLAAMTIVWCSVSATRLFEKGCNLREQRWLVGYPCVLLYSCFLMITIF